jgi:hypothetical protein
MYQRKYSEIAVWMYQRLLLHSVLQMNDTDALMCAANYSRCWIVQGINFIQGEMTTVSGGTCQSSRLLHAKRPD